MILYLLILFLIIISSFKKISFGITSLIYLSYLSIVYYFFYFTPHYELGAITTFFQDPSYTDTQFFEYLSIQISDAKFKNYEIAGKTWWSWGVILYGAVAHFIFGSIHSVFFLKLIAHVVKSVHETGSFKNLFSQKYFIAENQSISPSFKLSKFGLHFLISYIPYYLAWPLTIVVISKFPEYRATLISLSTVFTGINSVIQSIYIDPKLTQFEIYNKPVVDMYYTFLFCRFISCVIASLLSLIIYIYIS